MEKEIIKRCKEIEREKGIKILFAVESGSRLWRISSKDSDYDVRFVFVQPLENYLSLDQEKAVELVINQNFSERVIDMSGFDLFKFCRLLLKSNPSIIEWLQSDIIYYGKKPRQLVQIGTSQFSPLALYHHYKSMCRQNYEKYLSSKKLVTYKKYLYAMRGLINAKYVEATGELPPISFPECLDLCDNFIPKSIINELRDTIYLKREGKEKEIVKNNVKYDSYIEKFLAEKPSDFFDRVPDKEEINETMRKLLLISKFKPKELTAGFH